MVLPSAPPHSLASLTSSQHLTRIVAGVGRGSKSKASITEGAPDWKVQRVECVENCAAVPWVASGTSVTPMRGLSRAPAPVTACPSTPPRSSSSCKTSETRPAWWTEVYKRGQQGGNLRVLVKSSLCAWNMKGWLSIRLLFKSARFLLSVLFICWTEFTRREVDYNDLVRGKRLLEILRDRIKTT